MNACPQKKATPEKQSTRLMIFLVPCLCRYVMSPLPLSVYLLILKKGTEKKIKRTIDS